MDYYREVADVMVPHLKGRPLTLWRYPRGIDQQGFVQQDFAESLPDWMGRVEVAKEGGTVVHPVADRREAPAVAGQPELRHSCTRGCPGEDRLDAPDQVIFDLDPSGGDFAVVRATARAGADVLRRSRPGRIPEDHRIAGHARRGADADADPTSTRSGSSRAMSPRWSSLDDPAHRTVEQRKDNRGDRMYLDVMRNAYAQTAVAPYAVRARRGAPVATPLEWDELTAGACEPTDSRSATYRSG